MKTVELGRTGEQVSHLALGCMLMGTTTDEPTAHRMLDRYLDAGGGFLDTANCYGWFLQRGSRGGESESVLGRWMARGGRRDQVFLATKGTAMVRDPDAAWAGRDDPDWTIARRDFEGAGAQTLRRNIDDSLRRLGTDHIDLYYVHVDDLSTPLEETLEALAGIVRAGKARYIGWSNVRTWRLERIRGLCERNGWPAPVALQQQHSYLRRRAGLEHVSIVDDEQYDYLRHHDDLTLVAYSPILKGIYDDPAKREGHWAMDPYQGPDADARLAAVTEIAAEAGATPNQVVLAWLMHQERPRVVPLAGPRTLEQLEAALPALDVKLTEEQLARLDAAGA
ncbi:aldo/keto reductase [Allonocardiopsis opalescens]|uniref:Aryl-alcohol dehydrogenase-like predicted oxidoreductase n=1 Tax=Allonocardiopsis opalescens TaxID=1144618 RepID=A0A2T0Q7B3_9ACTN|nr:aldo/keto reductase [Allonocardiopsis opalescens]PRX99671.1 aryl-alcohol dehydrogenase-like predicted oxidoreductase [Allonocardiopsis opalescens]